MYKSTSRLPFLLNGGGVHEGQSTTSHGVFHKDPHQELSNLSCLDPTGGYRLEIFFVHMQSTHVAIESYRCTLQRVLGLHSRCIGTCLVECEWTQKRLRCRWLQVDATMRTRLKEESWHTKGLRHECTGISCVDKTHVSPYPVEIRKGEEDEMHRQTCTTVRARVCIKCISAIRIADLALDLC